MGKKNIFNNFDGFQYKPAIPYEKGLTRRDPSPVIKVDNKYYVWYSLTKQSLHGYAATIWYATSSDGINWEEQGQALDKGGAGSFDEFGVFTPSILVANEKYYLFYTAVPKPFDNDAGGPAGTKTAIGIAVTNSPEGPWKRFAGNPILKPSEDVQSFDSHRVDDSCLLVREGQFWLYYKGRQTGKTPGETKMGLAIAKSPTGPYIKYEDNPVLNGGHEVCVWPHGKGVGALVAPTGAQGNTLQYSQDGINFNKIKNTNVPGAPGPYRKDHYRDCSDGSGPGITWGLCHTIKKENNHQRPYLVRFECDLRK